MKNLWTVDDDGRLQLDLHYGQTRAWESVARFIAVIAGTQSGKTSFGPLWMCREIKERGPGDYMVVTPTFPLLELKALPEFLRLFQQTLGLGQYVGSPVRHFQFSASGARRLFGDDWEETKVIFGYAADPDSLESATAKGLWADEAGQKKFKLGSWEALQRRLSIYQGRALLTTTPYDLGWLKQQIWDKWKAGDKDIEVINFASTMNPAFPKEEFERARTNMPEWKFRMFYMGLFERPAGLIYGSFLEEHKVPRFALPAHWPRYMGMDFGGVNTAALFYAAELATSLLTGVEEPTGRLYLYREYKAGERTAAEHVRELLRGEPGIPTCVGGSKSEGQWRREFRAAGLPIREPDIKEVEVGIDRVYGTHKRGEILVFDDLEGYFEEKATYSRKLDDNGEPTEEIEDKASYHRLDAERYIIGWLKRPKSQGMR